jgi:hypothetical protein
MFETCEQFFAGNASAISECPAAEAFTGGFLGGALLALGITLAIFVFAALYVYHAFAWMRIAQKLKYKHAWFAWIPFLGTAMRLQLGGFHWAWTFLYLVPVLGWIALFVLLLISYWRVFESRNYPGFFGLAMVLPDVGVPLYLISIGFVAWKDLKKPMCN